LIASATREEEKLSLDVANLEFQIKKVKEKVRKKRKKKLGKRENSEEYCPKRSRRKGGGEKCCKGKTEFGSYCCRGCEKKGKNGKFFHKFSFAYIIRLYELIGDNFSEIRKYSVIISKKGKKILLFWFFSRVETRSIKHRKS